MSRADVVAGDRGTLLVVTITDSVSGELVDLTDKSVQVRYTLNGGSTEQRAMSLLNQVTQRGQAQYQFTPADLPAAGVIVGEVRLQAGLSDQLTTVDQFYLAVRAPLP